MRKILKLLELGGNIDIYKSCKLISEFVLFMLMEDEAKPKIMKSVEPKKPEAKTKITNRRSSKSLLKSEELKTESKKPETEKLKIWATDDKIEPFVYDKSDPNIDTKLTQYLDKCKDLGICVEEEPRHLKKP